MPELANSQKLFSILNSEAEKSMALIETLNFIFKMLIQEIYLKSFFKSVLFRLSLGAKCLPPA